jgi:hypothetical protein
VDPALDTSSIGTPRPLPQPGVHGGEESERDGRLDLQRRQIDDHCPRAVDAGHQQVITELLVAADVEQPTRHDDDGVVLCPVLQPQRHAEPDRREASSLLLAVECIGGGIPEVSRANSMVSS